MRADAGVRVQEPLQICLECRGKSKKCDKQLTHIVRVSVVVLRFRVKNVSKGTKLFEICCCPGIGIVDFKLIVIHRLCYVLDLS